MGLSGDFAKKNKKKLSKEELEKKARKFTNSNPTAFKLPEIIDRKKGY